MGGGLRQSGYIAATGLYAVDHHVDRLAKVHELAALIGERVAALPHIERVLPVEINIVIFEIASDGPSATFLVEALIKRGVRVEGGERTVSVVSHLGIDRGAGDILCRCLEDALVGYVA